ncbi:MAG: FHA domain-containing protein [Dermatophilaceae bacterium]|nr:FHA domain-containing protein [Intrasporangiaceae bacterium]
MSELTVTVLRLGLLAALWFFVFSIVTVLRSDLYGARIVTRREARRDARKGRPVAASGRAQAAGPTASGRRPRRGDGRGLANLTVTGGPLTGTSLPLREQGTLVGRNPECALVLDDDYASGRHAKIYREGEQWFVEDLGSTNGTFLVVNGSQQRLSAVTPVGPGTTLRFGKTVVELRS